MRTASKDDFKFFVPVDITKAKDGAGKEIMKIGGIASTKERDTDNEILDPNGFDLSYFLKSGFINWHHRSKDDPSAIIGEPTSAKITPDGLYFEGILYPDSDLANKVYKLAKDMEKSGSDRKLGFSIEGKVVERDAIDERFVKKAKVTGIAVTPTPKNAGTWLNILKGEFSNDEDEFDTTSNIFNGGRVELIVDILKPDGDRVTVDKDFNIKIVAKGLDTTSGAPLVKEDVEKVVHNQVGADTGKKHKKDFLVSKDLPTFDTTIKKSQAFLLLSNYVSDFEKAKTIYKEIEKSINSQSMKGNNITVSDEVANALKKFGLDPIDFEKGVGDELQKAKKLELKKAIDTKKKELEDMQAELDDTDEGGSKREKAPEETGSDDDEEEEEEEDEMVEDGKATGKKVKKKKVVEDDEVEKSKIAYGKGGAGKMIAKAVAEDLSKGLNVVKSHYESLEKANRAEFEKGISEIKDLVLGLKKSQTEFQESVIERVEAVENAKPGPKSFTTKRFIEKSFTSEDVKGKTELSIRDRHKVSSVLMAKAGIEKGEINDFYANAVSLYEATGQISKAISDDLFANSNIVLTN